jgi:hypothetical protein
MLLNIIEVPYIKMRYPLDELIDKTSIIKLKFERLGHLKDRSRWANEMKEYSIAIGEYIGDKTCTYEQIEDWFDRLYKANGETWDLEAAIRQGKDEELGLEEIGRRAIKIRENNGLRIAIKSEIVDVIGNGYKDIKINHISAD